MNHDDPDELYNFNTGEEDRRETDSKVNLLPEYLRRALATGLTAVFSTEEGIRNALGEMKIPKEAIAYLTQQTEKSRKEVVRIVSEEVRGMVQGIDLTGEIRKALTGMRLELKAELRFVEDGKVASSVEAGLADAASEEDDAETSEGGESQ